jgi:DNA-binding LacI/PurR family transcriptional regulator
MARMLLDEITEDDVASPRRLTLPTELVVRESS